jgi:hypothetical protein
MIESLNRGGKEGGGISQLDMHLATEQKIGCSNPYADKYFSLAKK